MKYQAAGVGESSASDCASLDGEDPLALYRERFFLPSGLKYCDGMSLGALPKEVPRSISKVIEQEWGEGLIRSWNSAGWIDAPRRLGGKLAPLLGADADEVVVADSTSVNLFKLLVAAIRLRPERHVIVVESSNFPTDIYVAEGVAELHPRMELRLVEEGELGAALDDDVAVALLTHVDYKTAKMHDLSSVTREVHRCGALVVWDLSHSTGAVPIDLHAADADMAAGCGYKYLNGGPGAPAFMFVAREHLLRAEQPITAWIGHDQPFEFSTEYVPARSVNRLLSGTPPIVSMAALEAALDLWRDVDLETVRAKSIGLSQLFLQVVESRLGDAAPRLLSPRDPNERGSHLAFGHPNGYEIVQALIDRGMIGDFREPEVMRFGFAPLYMRFTDVLQAAEMLVDVVASRAWDQPKYRERSTVT
ncbi:MAG: kynureninase [Planctomycetota bacterium]